MQPSQPATLTPEAQLLADSLSRQPQQHPGDETLHVDGVGGTLYFAYEQLRNAAEYTEQHLILRRAVERFLQRRANLDRPQPIAAELITDLTQARYLKNDSVALSTVAAMDDTFRQFTELYRQALGHHRKAGVVREWIFQTASVHLEQFLVPNTHTGAFSDFAYRHYSQAIHEPSIQKDVKPDTYMVALYCAVHRAIMKSDVATIRAYALSSRILQNGPEEPAAYFVALSQMIDELAQDRLTNRLVRLISQYGAPMRVLREVVVLDRSASQIIQDKGRLLERVRSVTQEQYAMVRKRLNQGIIRSIIFIAITKVLLGLGLEIPYDVVRHGHIVWRPLLMNILFPPLYMATLGLSIRQPSPRNFPLIEQAIERILYDNGQAPVAYKTKRRVTSPALNNTFNALYGVFFILVLAGVGYLLYRLGFNLVSGIIFFVFLSTVSFFGFRLTQTAREYEMIEGRRGTLGFIADFFYTPFIRIGHWLSDTYSRLNVVTRVLDLFIEMPLKTILRFMQQWVGFLRDKQEEI